MGQIVLAVLQKVWVILSYKICYIFPTSQKILIISEFFGIGIDFDNNINESEKWHS